MGDFRCIYSSPLTLLFCDKFCSSFSAVLSTIIGVHYGHVLVHMKVIFCLTFQLFVYLWKAETRTENSSLTCSFVLLQFQSHMDRLKQWVTMGIALLLLGIILHFSHGKEAQKSTAHVFNSPV